MSGDCGGLCLLRLAGWVRLILCCRDLGLCFGRDLIVLQRVGKGGLVLVRVGWVGSVCHRLGWGECVCFYVFIYVVLVSSVKLGCLCQGVSTTRNEKKELTFYPWFIR